ncbi:MAG TPA: hypothetical protein VL688_02890 [Verrucomicrobiae bacterium]|nr:hypothetical protein [Verrucomicrobiae bacterium]
MVSKAHPFTVRIFALLLALLLGLSPAAEAQQPPSGNGPERFLTVKKWGGTIDVETTSEWGYLQDCPAEDDANGGYTPMGKAWDTTVITTRLHYDVTLPAPVEEAPAEPDADEKALDQQMKMFEAMAKRMGMSDEDAGSEKEEPEVRSKSWGDAGAAGEESSVGPLGKGLLRWDEKSDYVCPNVVRRVHGRGEDTTNQIGAELSVLLDKDRKTYSIAAGSHLVPGEWSQFERTRGVYPICVAGTNETCRSYRKGIFYSTLRTQIKKDGRWQEDSWTTDPRAPEKSSSSSFQAMPHTLPVGGGMSAGLGVVDIDEGDQAFGPVPEAPDTASPQEAVQQFEQRMAAVMRKVERDLPATGMLLKGETKWEAENKDKPGFRDRTEIRVRWRLSPLDREKPEEPPKESCPEQAARTPDAEKRAVLDGLAMTVQRTVNDYKDALDRHKEATEAERKEMQQVIDDKAAAAKEALAANPQDAGAKEALDDVPKMQQNLEEWQRQQMEILKKIEEQLHEAEALLKEAEDIEKQGKTDLNGAVCRVPPLLERLSALQFQ